MSNKFLLVIAFLFTLVHKIYTEYSNTIYTGKVKSLVLVDDWHYLETHSMFWNQLRGISYSNLRHEFRIRF
jgi:hypothetical protein